MKEKTTQLVRLFSVILLIPLLGPVVTGCGTPKEKPLLSRGWIGGKVSVVKSFPRNMIPRPRAAILVNSLATNTPAAVAGLRAGDLVLALNHQPVGKLQYYHQKIDPLKPGVSLPVTAWRDGQIKDYTVVVGRESYHKGGIFTIYFPIVYSLNFWPHGDRPGLSLAALGYQDNSVNRVELGSVHEQYDLKCNPTNTPYIEDYKIWLGIVELSKGKRIAGQQLADAHD
jgi:hypothetical protein